MRSVWIVYDRGDKIVGVFDKLIHAGQACRATWTITKVSKSKGYLYMMNGDITVAVITRVEVLNRPKVLE